MKYTSKELYNKLVNEYKVVGEIGSVNFTLKDLTISVKFRETIENLIHSWLKAWLKESNVEFTNGVDLKAFPNLFLDSNDQNKANIQIKIFNSSRGGVFNLGDFESFGDTLLESAHLLDVDYLIFSYSKTENGFSIKNVWLKKIWELASPGEKFPIRVVEKDGYIDDIRSTTWYAENPKIAPFASLEEFLVAMNDGRFLYLETRHTNSHWLKNVVKNYHKHTGIVLDI